MTCRGGDDGEGRREVLRDIAESWRMGGPAEVEAAAHALTEALDLLDAAVTEQNSMAHALMSALDERDAASRALRSVLDAAAEAIPPEEHPVERTSATDWAQQIRNLGIDRRAVVAATNDLGEIVEAARALNTVASSYGASAPAFRRLNNAIYAYDRDRRARP